VGESSNYSNIVCQITALFCPILLMIIAHEIQAKSFLSMLTLPSDNKRPMLLSDTNCESQTGEHQQGGGQGPAHPALSDAGVGSSHLHLGLKAHGDCSPILYEGN
jgi:hypothetical protein